MNKLNLVVTKGTFSDLELSGGQRGPKCEYIKPVLKSRDMVPLAAVINATMVEGATGIVITVCSPTSDYTIETLITKVRTNADGQILLRAEKHSG